MIEVISEERCTACNICVRVCPVNVFDRVKEGIPIIARQDACQTCFLCEAWCPEDAMYVSPNADKLTNITEQELIERGLLGSYRKEIGWHTSTEALRFNDQTFKLSPMGSQ